MARRPGPALEQHDELIAADAADDARPARGVAKLARNITQQEITGGMAKRVVDVLEPV